MTRCNRCGVDDDSVMRYHHDSLDICVNRLRKHHIESGEKYKKEIESLRTELEASEASQETYIKSAEKELARLREELETQIRIHNNCHETMENYEKAFKIAEERAETAQKELEQEKKWHIAYINDRDASH